MRSTSFLVEIPRCQPSVRQPLGVSRTTSLGWKRGLRGKGHMEWERQRGNLFLFAVLCSDNASIRRIIEDQHVSRDAKLILFNSPHSIIKLE